MDGRKVDKSLESPIDNIMIKISEFAGPYFKKMNYTPNGLTTISLIFALAALYHLYIREGYYFAAYFVLSYLFDCMDGNYARRYGMVSDNGDMYDHYKDFSVIGLMIIIIYARYNVIEYPVALLVLVCIFILAMITLGCHENITIDEHKSDTLKIFRMMAPNRDTCLKFTEYFRYFGPGTLVITFVAIMAYIITKTKKQIIRQNAIINDAFL